MVPRHLVMVGDGELFDVLGVRPGMNLYESALGEVVAVVEVVHMVRHAEAAPRQVLATTE